MALLPLGVVGIPAFDGASWPAKLDAFQACSGNALCLCLRLGIDLELCSEREHSEDDISDDAAKQVLILGGVEDGGVQNNDNPLYREGISKDRLSALRAQYPDIYDEFVDQTESRIFKVVKSAIA